MELVLASASPQRRALLDAAGYRFSVVAADADELEEGAAPIELAELNARLKASAVASSRSSAVVVGADTVVALGARSFGKPGNEAEAKAMLAALSGGWHEVHTGVCVAAGESVRSATATTRVKFRTLGSDEVDSHIGLGEWRGRAGGYAIQESGSRLVEEIEGDLDTVIGLPLSLLAALLPEDVHAQAGS